MKIERVDKLPEVWPTEQDLDDIRRRWRSQGGTGGPYASYGTCRACNGTAYRFGKSYEGMLCFNCFVQKCKPKRKRKTK